MSEPRICSHCVMDSSVPGIVFDDLGQCNFCRDFAARLAAAPDFAERRRRRAALIAEVKAAGRGKRYDCVVGVSGGADSSYALYLALKEGLRPLAVHLDNGWNSELSVHNIATLVKRLGVDLHTHVIRWEENRDLQRAFIAADVIDIEMLMDSAMLATNFGVAAKFGVRYILSGSNSMTEGMAMPQGWNHHKWDARNARAIHRRFGTRPVPSHPFYSLRSMMLDRYVRRIRWVPFLDHYDYDKARAMALLREELGYKPYPYKHYESVFTRYYQGEILPRKFGVDKRRVHLSALVISGQIDRGEALRMIEQHPYPDPMQLRDDAEFVAKKLGYTAEEFQAYLRRPPVSHDNYASEAHWQRRLSAIARRLRRLASR